MSSLFEGVLSVQLEWTAVASLGGGIVLLAAVEGVGLLDGCDGLTTTSATWSWPVEAPVTVTAVEPEPLTTVGRWEPEEPPRKDVLVEEEVLRG